MDFSFITNAVRHAVRRLHDTKLIVIHPRPTYYHVVLWSDDNRHVIALKASGQIHWFK